MSSNQNTSIRVHWMGKLARDLLSTHQTAAVFSIISRGIFLRFNFDRMIFLSLEKYRGPLTANISGDNKNLRECSTGERTVVSPQGILLTDSGIHISTSTAKIWDAPLPSGSPLSADERLNRVRELASAVFEWKGETGLSEMLPGLAGFNKETVSQDHRSPEMWVNIDKMRDLLAKADLRSMFPILQSFLGLGSGLTPSGDDFVTGFLLSLNRWKSVIQASEALPTLNDQMIEAAYRSTTTLSANLIQSATLGLADERLIQAVDYLAVGKYHPSEVLNGLLEWGSSSGADALAGMLTAFLPV